MSGHSHPQGLANLPTEYPTSIRLPDDIRRGMRKWSRHNKRSLTREIVVVLEDWLGKNPAPGGREKKAEPLVEEVK